MIPPTPISQSRRMPGFRMASDKADDPPAPESLYNFLQAIAMTVFLWTVCSFLNASEQ